MLSSSRFLAKGKLYGIVKFASIPTYAFCCETKLDADK